jgi:hypothetical protein
MKFITSLSTYTVTATTGAVSSAYGVNSIKDDYPSHPFISSDTTETLTLSYSAGPDSLFLGHVLAESVTVTFDTGESYTYTNRIDWNRTFAKGRKKLADDLFINVPTSSTSVTIDLENTTDLKEDITSFLSNGTDGYLSDGASAILFADYPQLRVGTTLQNSGGGSQIKELKGTGSGSADVVLFSGGSSGFTLTGLILPVSVGIIRLGYKTSFPNPSIGFTQAGQDFGIRRENFGTMLYSPKDFVRSYTVPLRMNRTQLDTFTSTFDGLRGQPIPTDLLESVNTSLVGFMTMAGTPEIVANLRRYTVFDVTFEIREVG